MTTDLSATAATTAPRATGQQEPPSDLLARLDAQVEQTLRESLAVYTRHAYAADWRVWSVWAAEYDLAVLLAAPVELARYLVDQAGPLAVGTLIRRLSVIRKAHLSAGHPANLTLPSPVWGVGQGISEVRDRALVLLAFTSALRRRELADLDLADLEPDPAGLVLYVGRSKTDQDAEGTFVGIPYAGRPQLRAALAIRVWTERLTELRGIVPAELTGSLSRTVDRRGRLGSPGWARTRRCPPRLSARP
jgi:integrase